ncbi:hypothetical protein ABPG77_001646 [Micractinium sp. CCAP 211/92]
MGELGAEAPVAVTEQKEPAKQQQIAEDGDGPAVQDATASGSPGGDGPAGAAQPASDAPAATEEGPDKPAPEVKAEPAAVAAEAAAAQPAQEQEGNMAQQQATDEQAAANEEQDIKEDVKEEEGEGAKASPSDDALVARLRELLAEVDLATTTEKQLRKRLEGEFGVQLGDRKALLRAEINAYLEAQSADEEEEEEQEVEEEEQPSRGRKRKGAGFGDYISAEMQEFLGEKRLPRTQVVKRLWAYIKENNLQDPNDKRTILFDDALKQLFPGTKTTMFKLQKLLSKHCKTSDVVGGSEDEEEEDGEDAPAPAAKRPRQASSSGGGGRRKSKGGGEEGKQRKPGGFTKECKLSDEMAAWIGKPTASRPEITKFFWEYAKNNELKDPSDKSFILADDTLQRLTGEKRFKGFSFAKFIKNHIRGYADQASDGEAGGAGEEEAEAE